MSEHGGGMFEIMVLGAAACGALALAALPQCQPGRPDVQAHVVADDALHASTETRLQDTEARLDELQVAVDDLKADVRAVLDAPAENVIIHYPKDSGLKPTEAPSADPSQEPVRR